MRRCEKTDTRRPGTATPPSSTSPPSLHSSARHRAATRELPPQNRARRITTAFARAGRRRRTAESYYLPTFSSFLSPSLSHSFTLPPRHSLLLRRRRLRAPFFALSLFAFPTHSFVVCPGFLVARPSYLVGLSGQSVTRRYHPPAHFTHGFQPHPTFRQIHTHLLIPCHHGALDPATADSFR